MYNFNFKCIIVIFFIKYQIIIYCSINYFITFIINAKFQSHLLMKNINILKINFQMAKKNLKISDISL